MFLWIKSLVRSEPSCSNHFWGDTSTLTNLQASLIQSNWQSKNQSYSNLIIGDGPPSSRSSTSQDGLGDLPGEELEDTKEGLKQRPLALTYYTICSFCFFARKAFFCPSLHHHSVNRCLQRNDQLSGPREIHSRCL